MNKILATILILYSSVAFSQKNHNFFSNDEVEITTEINFSENTYRLELVNKTDGYLIIDTSQLKPILSCNDTFANYFICNFESEGHYIMLALFPQDTLKMSIDLRKTDTIERCKPMILDKITKYIFYIGYWPLTLSEIKKENFIKNDLIYVEAYLFTLKCRKLVFAN